MHRSCALYSAISCPWLKSSRSRGRRSDVVRSDDMIIRGLARHGAVFTDAGPLLDTFSANAAPLLVYGYVDPVEVIPCGSWRDLLPAYEAAVAAESIDTATRLHWGPDDDDRLADCARADETTLTRLLEAAVPFVPGQRLALL
jgi:hypothetical protein